MEPAATLRARETTSPRPIPAVEVAAEPRRGLWASAPLGLIAAALALCAVILHQPSADDARRRRIVADAYALAGKVREYRMKVGFELDPATWSGWVASRLDPRLFDPWGTPYGYRAGTKTFSIICYGADGAPGGDGVAKDTEFSFRTGSGTSGSANNIP